MEIDANLVPEIHTRKVQQNYFCDCDLTVNACDTNCCCDIDCPPSAIRSFDCHLGGLEKQPSYLTGYGLPPCSVSSSWFCVVNVDFAKLESTSWTFDNAKGSLHKRWPESFPVDNDGDKGVSGGQTETYRYNDDLMMFNEVTEEVVNIRLPISIYGPDCHLGENIRFLHNQKSNCEGVSLQFIERYLRNISDWKILSDPRFNSHMISEHCAELGSEFCIQMQLFVCGDVNCTLTNETWSMNDTADFSRIRFEFGHNFTNIKEAKVSLTERVNYTEAHQNLRTFTTIEVEFIAEAARNDSFVFRASGNVGYDNGMPLLVSQYSRVNTSDAQETLIDFFRPGHNSSNVVSIPGVSDTSDECSRTPETINFNHNSLSQCNFKLPKELHGEKEGNITTFCRKFQNEIFKLIYKNETVTFDQLFVAQFGNPRNHTKYWRRMERISSPFDLEKVTGDLVEDSLVCRNMVLEIGLSVFYAKITDEASGAKYQSLVQKITVDFGSQLDLQFSVNEEVAVPITVKVIFVDLTSRSGGVSRLISGKSIIIVFCALISLLARRLVVGSGGWC